MVMARALFFAVMAGLGPAIHALFFLRASRASWMPATSAGMTGVGVLRHLFFVEYRR
jgi:hypothetical protein